MNGKIKGAYCKHIAALLLFGSNGIVASSISLSSYEIVLFRALIGDIFLALIFLFTRQKPAFLSNKKDLLFIACSGLSMGISWMLLYEAYNQVGVSIASLLYYTGPVIVMALSPILFRERLTATKIFCFLLVLAGIFFINENSSGGGSNTFGVFCGLFSALTYAAMVIFNKKCKQIRGLENTTLQLLFALLTVAVFVGFKQGFSMQIRPNDWVWIFLLGLVNTGIGCYLYFSSIRFLPVQTVAVCGYFEPLSALLFSAWLLRERLTPLQLLGAAFILGGALFGELRGQKRTTPTHE